MSNADKGGRREADSGKPPAEPGDTPAAIFAARLRQLRADAGSPTFRRLSEATHYSVSTLAEATLGRRFPTEAVVRAFAVACGADPEYWAGQLRDAVGAARLELSPPAFPPGDAEAGDAGGDGGLPARLGRRAWITAACSVSALVAGVANRSGSRNAETAGRDATSPAAVFTAQVSTPPTTRHALDGEDPVVAGCAAAALLVDKQPIMLDGVQIGALELKYSWFCGAGWARVYLYPGQPDMLGFVDVVSNDRRSSSFEDPLIGQVPVYTDVIVKGAGGCLAAHAVVYATGKPPAEAEIPCQAPATPTPASTPVT